MTLKHIAAKGLELEIPGFSGVIIALLAGIMHCEVDYNNNGIVGLLALLGVVSCAGQGWGCKECEHIFTHKTTSIARQIYAVIFIFIAPFTVQFPRRRHADQVSRSQL